MNKKVKVLGIKDMTILPPDPRVCQECAVDHEPELPHDKNSLHYQYSFYQKNDRWPTWTDAMAHCDQKVKDFWISALEEIGEAIE